jgi:hypothetical protein
LSSVLEGKAIAADNPVDSVSSTHALCTNIIALHIVV